MSRDRDQVAVGAATARFESGRQGRHAFLQRVKGGTDMLSNLASCFIGSVSLNARVKEDFGVGNTVSPNLPHSPGAPFLGGS